MLLSTRIWSILCPCDACVSRALTELNESALSSQNPYMTFDLEFEQKIQEPGFTDAVVCMQIDLPQRNLSSWRVIGYFIFLGKLKSLTYKKALQNFHSSSKYTDWQTNCINFLRWYWVESLPGFKCDINFRFLTAIIATCFHKKGVRLC